MSVAELRERHVAATETVNSLRVQLKQRRQLLLDTDVATYARSHGIRRLTLVRRIWCVVGFCRVTLGRGHPRILLIPCSGIHQVYSLDWTPERNWIVSASQDSRLIVWNALTSQKTHAIKLPCAWVMTCTFSPNGQSVACGSQIAHVLFLILILQLTEKAIYQHPDY